MSEADGPSPPDQSAEATWKPYVLDVLSSVSSVLFVVVMLFAVSGVWPPLVAIESGSMEPRMQPGDLVFVMDEARFQGDGAHGATGVVTARSGAEGGYTSFGGPGDVVVYAPDGKDRPTPIIHRAMFWVEDGQNWYDDANGEYLGDATNCEELRDCPAPHAGFVTKGDANARYDQVLGFSGVVRPAWVVGTAEARIPWFGCLRLRATSATEYPQRCELGLS